MDIVRKAHAVWQGPLKQGKGSVDFGAGDFEYSFASRFEQGAGTSPEALIAAAHAACYSMALAHTLTEAGYRPEKVETRAMVHLAQATGGFEISQIELSTEAEIPEELPCVEGSGGSGNQAGCKAQAA